MKTFLVTTPDNGDFEVKASRFMVNEQRVLLLMTDGVEVAMFNTWIYVRIKETV